MGISPTRRNRKEIVGFIKPDDLYGYDPSHIGKDKEPFIYMYRINIIDLTRHVGALRGSAWRCHVALRATSHPRGSRAPFFFFFLFFNVLNRK